MALTKEKKAEIIKEYGKAETNTGATETQIALMTQRINDLTEHLKLHVKDHSTRRGLLKLVGHRRRLLKYYKTNHLDQYRELIQKLGLRK
jgi:small subunit ribosomal protein S15